MAYGQNACSCDALNEDLSRRLMAIDPFIEWFVFVTVNRQHKPQNISIF